MTKHGHMVILEKVLEAIFGSLKPFLYLSHDFVLFLSFSVYITNVIATVIEISHVTGLTLFFSSGIFHIFIL